MTSPTYRPSVLFFGRKEDTKSEECLKHLKNLEFDVSVIWSSKRSEKLPEDIGEIEIDYILCYRSYFILPKSLVDSPKFYSINFHPGPPKYPGSGGINFSLFNNDNNFGVTVHLMNEKVDNGKILATKFFPIFENDNLNTLLNRTHDNLFNLFIEFTTNLRKFSKRYIDKNLNENKDLCWGDLKRTIKDIDRYQLIDKDIDEIELKKRIRGFNIDNYPIELKLHGRSFTLKKDELKVNGKKEIILIGGGGHCKSVIDVIELEGKFIICGIVDNKPELLGTNVLGYPIIGNDLNLKSLAKKYTYALITVGQLRTPEARIRLFNLAKKAGFSFPRIISSRAYISDHTVIGDGTVVMHDTSINAGVSIGDNCIINSRSLIEHDSKIFDHCHISTNVTINGVVTIEEGCFIGSGVITNNSIRIKKNSFIKAGSIVK
jgi:sugar O-acyltransferase (sialic acid O-acetyltransferase NeuD family)